jgi:AraC-like DNA-binding protein
MTMTGIPDVVIGTPLVASPELRAELLGDLLSHIRLSGALFMLGRGTAPFALDSPGNCALADLVSPGAERLLVFHVVRRGHFAFVCKGLRLELGPGDLVVLPNADRHLICSAETVAPVPIAEMLPPTPWNSVPIVYVSGGGEHVELVCGYFRCDELLFNAVLRRLPSMFKVRPHGAAAIMLNAAVDYALEDGSSSGGETTMSHITQMLLSETLKLYAEQGTDTEGWLAAAADPVVGRALKAVHADPHRDWTIEDLARAANTSRTVLGERCKAMLGQSPIHYLAEWRMQLAAELLRTTEAKLADVAARFGYSSEAAFSRAFTRHVGESPARWREVAKAQANTRLTASPAERALVS